eukprot:1601970-Amphidinium_carterae.2
MAAVLLPHQAVDMLDCVCAASMRKNARCDSLCRHTWRPNHHYGWHKGEIKCAGQAHTGTA